jgi:hypothetical protein
MTTKTKRSKSFMNIKPIIVGMTLGLACTAVQAEDVPIVGNVQAKCSIFTDTAGVYGNPTPNELSTDSADGGVAPIIRYDVAQADYYTARIRYPNSFSSAPTLTDSVTWTGSTTVSATSDTGMAGYEAAKVEFDNATEYDLTVAGTTWFSVTSNATYGFNSAFPAGQYTAIVEAECIAN